MKNLLWLLGFACVLALPAGAVAQTAPDSTRDTSLRPGDALRLRIWREPDLSGDFPIDENGVATLPRLGPVDVTGIQIDSLKARLIHDYAVYLNNPSIEVIPLRRVSVLGAVRTPGLYPVDPTMRVSDVLALAGGAAPDGKIDKLELRRNGHRVEADLSLGSSIAHSPIQSGDELYVPQKSWLSRNPWLFSGIIGAVATVTVALTR